MNETLTKIANKKYESSGRHDLKLRNKDITLIVNDEGDAVTLFIGKRKPNGDVAGELYVRNFRTKNGVQTSHWDRKGKV
jgi:hypothetical protein